MDQINRQKRKTCEHINWIWTSIGFAGFYWIIESVRDVIVFEKGGILERIFWPDTMSVWLRLLVVCILVLFGVYAQSLKERLDKSKRGKYDNIGSDHVIKAGLGFGLLYWLLDSARGILLEPGGNILERIIFPQPMEFWMRILAIFVLLLFSMYAQALINERKRAEEMLRESEERLEQIIQQMPYPIRVTSTNGVTTMVNKAFLQTFRISSPDDIVGKDNPFKDPLLTDPQTIERARETYSGKTVFIPEINVSLNEEKDDLILEATLFPVFRENGRIWRIVTIWKNITDQKQAEQEKNKIQGQLHQAQKMNAIGILAGGIAHDFNNLLTAIQGSADMILMDHDEDKQLVDDLHEIKRASHRATELTRQLLLFSRKAPMGFKPHDLNKSIESLQKMIQRLIGEDIRVKIELDPNLFTVNADPSTMEQVIMNLVVNARDAMPQGGELTISTDNVILTPDACRHIPDANSGEHICLSVADTGCGMDTETLQHIFEPFFTTKEPGAGTGLGLSVVYGILQQHNGWINVYSHCDVGSVFKVYLPIIHDKPQDTEENVKQIATSIQGKGERILVIEDDENVRNFTISALRWPDENEPQDEKSAKPGCGNYHLSGAAGLPLL